MRQSLLFFVLILITTAACKTKKENSPCGGIYNCPLMASLFSFTIKDSTGKDYFFSSPPQYPISALKVSDLLHDTIGYYIFPDSASRHLRYMGVHNGQNAVLLTIGSLPPDTLRFYTQFNYYGCCGMSSTFSDISFDNRPVTRVINTDSATKYADTFYVLSRH